MTLRYLHPPTYSTTLITGDAELPDGVCFRRVQSSGDCLRYNLQYVGSFPVKGSEPVSRSQVIRKYSQSLRSGRKPRPVQVVISLSGIKVCSPLHAIPETYMGHALKRISHSSCEPGHRLFSFVAREPTASHQQQPRLFCHTFVAETSHQAEEVNSIVGNAFRMAYAAQLQPSIHQVTQKTIDQPIFWPKEIPGKAEMRECQVPTSIPGLVVDSNRFEEGLADQEEEDSNSPTQLNSCKRLEDKPLPVKRIPITPISHSTLPPQKFIDSDNNRVSDRKRRSSSSCSGESTPPPPERTDSLRIESELQAAPWFQAGIPREITLEVLGQEPVGSFMVRESTSKPGCYALSLRVPREFQPHGIAHYLILRTKKGFKINGFTKEFSSLTALITHHSVMPELLPCPLSLSRYNPSFTNADSNTDFADINADPDYNTIAHFRRMMADLNV